MDIRASGLAGVELLGTPVWLVDVARARLVWCNAAAGRLRLATDAAVLDAPPGDGLAAMFAAHLVPAGHGAQAREGASPGLALTLSDEGGETGSYLCRALVPPADLEPGLVAVEGVPQVVDGSAGLDAWLSASAAILAAAARGEPVVPLLGRIIAMIEAAMPGACASVVLLDTAGRRIAQCIAPSLPESYNAALIGLEIGPGSGSCGVAMHERRRVVAADIASDAFWEGYHGLAREAGLAACWSEPILSAGARAVGSFAIYRRWPGGPDRTALRVMESAGHLASIALEAESRRAEAEAARERLAASEARLRSLIDASPSVIFLKDGAGRYRMVNRAFCETYGAAPDEVIGRTAIELLGRDAALDCDADDRSLSPDRPVIARRRENPLVPGLVQDITKFLVRRADGGVDGIGAIATDVSDLHAAEAAQAVLSERLALAVEAAGIGVIDYDIATGALLCNPRMAEIYGVTHEQAARMTRPEDWMALVHPADSEHVHARFADAVEGHIALHAAFRIKRPEGTVRHIRSAARVIREGGRPARVVGVNLDVTADVVMAEALAERSREAEAANRAKSRFLASVSHELRTPLNGVLGCAQLLGQGDLSAVQRRHLDVIESSGQALLELIEDLLDIGRIESGTVALEPAPFDLADLVASTLAMVRDMAEARGLALIERVDPALAAPRLGDVRRLRQILLNLLSNSVKFTATGHVVLAATARSDGGVGLSVSDTGPGIPPAERGRVFEPFARLESEGRQAAPGTGLGLAIVRELVHLMGGEIAVTTAPGGGAQFDVELPLSVAEGAAAPTGSIGACGSR